MEGKKSTVAAASSSSSSLASQLFGSSPVAAKSSSSGLFDSVFASPSSSAGGRRDPSSRSDIFGPYKKPDSLGSFWNGTNQAAPDVFSRGGQSRGGQSNLLNKEGGSLHQGEKIDPCSLSSSLYYGGQDICSSQPNSRYSGSPYTRSYARDGEGNSASSAIDSRGDWWQGSLYY